MPGLVTFVWLCPPKSEVALTGNSLGSGNAGRGQDAVGWQYLRSSWRQLLRIDASPSAAMFLGLLLSLSAIQSPCAFLDTCATGYKQQTVGHVLLGGFVSTV